MSEYDTDNHQLIVEGEIVSLQTISPVQDFAALARILLHEPRPEIAALREWQRNHTGEYVIAGHRRGSDQWVLLTDALGRLPSYYLVDDDGVTIGRDIQAVVGGRTAIDRLSLAQYLLFGYPIGFRTLFAGMKRVPPGSCLIVGAEGQLQIDPISTLNLQDESSENYDAQLERIESAFVAACQQLGRDERRVLVSLSGGLDSRSVAGGLVRAGVSFSAVTFVTQDNQTSRDAARAEEVMRTLGLPWQLMQLGQADEAAREEIIAAKAGLVYLGQAYDVEFFRRLRGAFGDQVTFVSGDGGDKCLPYLLPARRLTGISELVDFIVATQTLLSLAEVSELTGVAQDDIRASIRDTVDAYPESSPDYKYFRFLISERAMQWLFEGEDRNRYQFWATTPCYREPFFSAVMQCPQRFKRRHRLYRDFLERLSPALAGIPDANRGMAPRSWKFTAYLQVADLMKKFPGLAAKARSLRKGRSRALTVAADEGGDRAATGNREKLAQYVNVECYQRLLAPGAETGAAARDLLKTLENLVNRMARR